MALFRSSASLAFISCVTAFVVPVQAASETASILGVSEEGLRRQEKIQNESLKQLQQKNSTLSSEKNNDKNIALPDEDRCFLIERTIVRASNDVEIGWISKEVEQFANHCIGVEGLKNIIAYLNEGLVEKGFVTSKVSLPRQNLRDGILKLQFHAGVVDTIVFSSKSNGEEKLKKGEHFFFPFTKGDILNIRDLEQGVENISRLKSQTAKVRIVPGRQQDSSKVVLDRAVKAEDTLRGGITLSNSGNRDVSKTQASVYIVNENGLGIGDVFNISANSSVEKVDSENLSQSLSAQYSVPIGYSHLNFSHTYTRFSQVVSGTTARFVSSGSSHSTKANLKHTFYRDASTKVLLHGGLSFRSSNSFLDDIELLVQRRNTVNVDVGGRLEKHFSDGLAMEVDLSIRKGVGWFGAEHDLIDVVEGGATLRPYIWNLSLDVKKPILSDSWLYSSRIYAQHTDDNILTNEQFSIGSRYSVRGFDGESVLLAESGLYWRNEWQKKPGSQTEGSWYGGLDAGIVYGPSSGQLSGKSLVGMAFGWRGELKSIYIDASIGIPIIKPDAFETEKLNPYLSLVYEL